MKKALCVGVNDYPLADMDLKGCVNDAKDWASLLVGHYDFARPDVNLLLDKHATKANVMQGLKELVTGANAGDVLVFCNSSHGTYVADANGDEKVYDEAMCPWDTKDHLIVDDELRELFGNLPDRVRLTVISDSCFSGTLTRAALSTVKTPDDRRARFLNPSKIGLRELPDVRRKAKPRRRAKPRLYPESRMGELLLSGCTDRQYSYDAKINGRYNGAMSRFALDVIAAKNYKLTYKGLRQAVVRGLKQAQYEQEPQLEGKDANKSRQLFT